MNRSLRTVILSSLLSLLILSCTDDSLLGPPGFTPRHAVALLDSTITLKAQYLPPSSEPSIHLQAGVTLRILADSAQVTAYSAGIGTITKHYTPATGMLTYNSQYTIALQELFSGITPFVSHPIVQIEVQMKTFVGATESTYVFLHASRNTVDWTGVAEPTLKDVATGDGLGVGALLWANDNSGFYFPGIVGTKNVVSFYRLSDSSVARITPEAESILAFDLSHAGTELLTGPASDDGSLSLLDPATGASTPIFAPLTGLRITSAAFSSNDSAIAFSVQPAGSPFTGDLWLVRRGAAPGGIPALQGIPSPRVLRWLATSNDKFFYLSGNTPLFVYSVSDSTVSAFPIGQEFLPCAVLDDGFTVLGIRYEHDGSTVIESHVWKYTITGQPVRQLTFADEVISALRLSPDGTQLAFIAQRGGNVGLYVLNVAGVLAKRGS